MLYIGLFLSVFTLTSNGAPGDDFDLNNFYLEEPSQGKYATAEELENGYTDPYFYSDPSDGAMTFYVPNSGEESYPRCELREQCNPGNNDYNWDLSDGTHQLKGIYEIGTDTTANYFIIAQIHSKNGPGKPLLKIRYYETDDGEGAIRVEVKTDEGGVNEMKVYETESWAGGYTTKVNKGEQFEIRIQVKSNKVKVWFNGDRMVKRDISYWSDFLCYFKTGNYKTQTDDANVQSYVKIHSLSVTHSESSSCNDVTEWDAFIYEEDSAGNTTLTTAGIIVIIMGVLIAIALCGFAGYCYYKKRYLASKGEATFEDNVDEPNKESGDTSMVDDNESGNNETPTSHDMEEIEVDIEHVDH